MGQFRNIIAQLAGGLTALPLALFLLSTHALAEWRYAQWGMSREQLIEASKGAVAPHYEPNPESWGEYPAAKGKVWEMQHNFEAWFYIDPYDGLYAVRLVPTGNYWCIDIRERAMQRWGYTRHLDDGFQMFWAVPGNNNHISIIDYKGCSVKFQPLDLEKISRPE